MVLVGCRNLLLLLLRVVFGVWFAHGEAKRSEEKRREAKRREAKRMALDYGSPGTS